MANFALTFTRQTTVIIKSLTESFYSHPHDIFIVLGLYSSFVRG